MTRLTLLAAALTLTACNVDDDEELTSDVLTGAMPIIFEGLSPDRAAHDAVVALHDRDRGGNTQIDPFCTGTLITPDVVLTAAHCVDTAGARARRFNTMDPSKLSIFVGDRPRRELPVGANDVVEILIHPRYNRRALVNDIAMVRLAAPVSGVTPVPHLPQALGLSRSDRGRAVNFAGFGLREDGGDGRKLHVDVDLAGPGCAVRGCSDPGDPFTQVSYLQRDGGPCSGDSGGPLLLQRGPQTFVAGVTSFGDYNCTRWGVSTRVDAFEGFIDDFIAN